MKFSNGFFDSIFGKKTTIEVPLDDGTARKVRVTEAWLKRMEAEGRITPTEPPGDEVDLHIVGPDGYECRRIVVGRDIPLECYRTMVDRESKALYALKIYEQGKPSTKVVSKEIWNKAKAQFDAIDKQSEQFMHHAAAELRQFSTKHSSHSKARTWPDNPSGIKWHLVAEQLSDRVILLVGNKRTVEVQEVVFGFMLVAAKINGWRGGQNFFRVVGSDGVLLPIKEGSRVEGEEARELGIKCFDYIRRMPDGGDRGDLDEEFLRLCTEGGFYVRFSA